ncbi:phosphoadenosine phosphosulfate reductase [Photobacterium damselae subsp. damselae]|uniref:Phosphoadenosine phosphosulfate reductase family protein n=1 Tax=Photobacterium damselae subsp. damselae TaxID=85581 RepID=A0AAD3WYT4_PHODD|nr:phosphoadenosine phosphosulfate reductase family protein [Photobacterium damselae]KAB1185705.1 phosphoadenosine phosphosulfate reductase family protein [Photobacterium damselae subsp. damselae]PSB85300.1 phosphoadenosine phosphosulfate reductase [Photobacterium damselae subsp. damselae]
MKPIDFKQVDNWDDWMNGIIDADMNIGGECIAVVNRIYDLLLAGKICQLAYSSGKDSETVLGLFLLALMKAVRNGDDVSPYHFITHIDTKVENPEIRNLADRKLSALKDFIEANKLPLTIVIAQPSITSSWLMRIIGGRGLPTFANSEYRQCSQDLKVATANRATSSYLAKIDKSLHEHVILILGSRDTESQHRSDSIAKFGGSSKYITTNADTKGRVKSTFYPIKEWSDSDVWDFLSNSGTGKFRTIPSYLPNHYETIDLYRASGNGECVYFQSSSTTKQGSCSARHGCFVCVAGNADKSMEKLITTDAARYGYMAGINRIQRFLYLSRYNWDYRHVVGRTISAAGYIQIRPDTYHPDVLAMLLHALISFDYLEKQRADAVANKLKTGEIEDNDTNRRMATPMFQYVTETDIIGIEALWSLHAYQKQPFSAIKIWHQVYTFKELETLDFVDHLDETPRTPIPAAHWLYIGQWSDSDFDGFHDFYDDMTSFDVDFNSDRQHIDNGDGTVTHACSINEDLSFDIDPEGAKWLVHDEFLRLALSQQLDAYTHSYSVQMMLRSGIVSLPKGKLKLYNHMARRGQCYSRLGISGAMSIDDILAHSDLTIISDKEHKVINDVAKIQQVKRKAAETLALKEAERIQRITRRVECKIEKGVPFEAYSNDEVPIFEQIMMNKVTTLKSNICIAMNVACEELNYRLSGKIEGVQYISHEPLIKTLSKRITVAKSELHDHYLQQLLLSQLDGFKELLEIFNSGYFDKFSSDHFRELAINHPDVFDQMLKNSIKQCNSELKKFYLLAA